MTNQDLAGVWNLKIFEITDPSGITRPWGKNTTGKIIYTESGYVSCAFNSDPEMTNPSFEDLYDCLLEGKVLSICSAGDFGRSRAVWERLD